MIVNHPRPLDAGQARGTLVGMKRPGLVLCLAALTCLAGPVGQYLGYEVDRTETSIRTGRDSIHYFLPAPGDTILVSNLTDTTTVLAETLLTEPAWVLRQALYGDSVVITIDTMYESGDTVLHQPWSLGDSSRWYNHYLVPFNVGTSWRTGLEGTFYADIDGDGTIDTMSIWADTVQVTGIEDVTVPYGLVEDCWVVKTTMRQAVALTYQSIPARETAEVCQVQWYKDSLWAVKDSSYVLAHAYVQVVIWLPAADIVSQSLGQLAGIWTGVQEPPTPGWAARISAGPNPFRRSTVLHLSAGPLDHSTTAVSIFDASGRLIRTLPASGVERGASSVVWDGRNDLGRDQPAGIYIVRSSNGDAVLPTVVVKTE